MLDLIFATQDNRERHNTVTGTVGTSVSLRKKGFLK